MLNPYFISILIYLAVAILAAIDSSLVSLQLLPFVNGLRWIRVHMITLGVLTQLIFAISPMLVARRNGHEQPFFRWDIWALLNAGILALVYGISLINTPVILLGGTLIFLATGLLMAHLNAMKSKSESEMTSDDGHPNLGRKFYISGLAFFGLGIIIGTGLWLGWPAMLQMKVPIEVHIHANNWGLMSLVFAGFLVDLYPHITGRNFSNPKSINTIFWLMTLGALGLVLGPWTGEKFFTVPGLLMHVTATIWLLSNVIKPLRGDKLLRSPGIMHLTASYFWLLAPITAAPLVLLDVPGVAGAGIEANAPQALIYGWVLQFGFALLPYFFSRAVNPNKKTHSLGGSWAAFWMVNLGGVLLWLSIFIEPISGLLHGSAYLLWAASIAVIARQIWGMLPREVVRLVD